jgi:hypothetical protein
VGIVISILLAFSIQAWWEGRKDRNVEIVVLSNLLQELREIQTNIGDIQKFQVEILASTYKLAELAEHPNSDISDQEIDQLIEDQTWLSSPDNFSAPLLKAILERGDDKLISDRHLRARLILLPKKLDWIRVSMQEDLNFTHLNLEPYLYEHASLLHLFQVNMTRPGTPEITFVRPRVELRTTFSHKKLLESREFQNLLLQRSVLLEDIISLARNPELPSEIDELITLIERDLDRLRP